MTIRNRLIAWLLPLLLISPAISILLNLWSNDELDSLVSRLDTIGEQVVSNANEISKSLEDNYKKELLASYDQNLDHMKLLLDQEISSLERVAETMSTLPTIDMWIMLKNSDEDNFLRNTISDHFQQIVEDCGLVELSILDRDGNEKIRVASHFVKPGGDPIVDGVPLENKDTNESRYNWYQAFANSQTRSLVYADLCPDFPTQIPVITICRQLRLRSNVLGNDFETADGILKLSITLDKMCKHLTGPEQVLENNRLYLVNNKNNKIYFDSASQAVIGSTQLQIPKKTMSLRREITGSNLDCYLLIDESVFSVGDNGSNELTSVLLSNTEDGKEIVEKINAQLTFNNTMVIIISILVGIGFSAIVFLVSKSFTQPIKQLNKATHQIAIGNLSHPIAIDSKDEIGRLALDFDIMRTKVAEQLKALKDSNRAMESAMRIKSTFMANMSHEIRTPLNGMLGMAELLCDTELDAFQKEQLDVIRTSGQDLLTVINDILDYSKIESDNMELEQRPFDIWEMARDVMRLFAGRAHDKGLHFNVYIDPRIKFELIGDVHRIKQILSNLISNALKFTHKGMVFFRVECVSCANDELCTTKFSVIDSGIGIEQESQQKIFESFNQEDVSTTRRFGGTGLGLTISKKLTKLMGGDLQLDSQQGAGSTFSFQIDLPKGAELKNITQVDEFHGDVVIGCGLDPLSEKILKQYTEYLKLEFQVSTNDRTLESMIAAINDSGKKVCLLIVDLHNLEAATVRELFRTCDRYNCIGIDNFDRISPHRLKDLHVRSVLAKPIDYKKFKRALAMQEERPVESPTPTPSHAAGTDFAEKRILLAEDNPVNQKVVHGYLKSNGVKVDIASNGVEAIKLLEQHDYDLILMDCHMPEMDGYEATVAIRRQEQGTDKHIPIVALTANAMSGDREKCLQIGMDDYLSKPLKRELLFQTLNKWFSKIIK